VSGVEIQTVRGISSLCYNLIVQKIFVSLEWKDMNRNDLLKQARIAADELLKEKGYISFIDVFMKLGYLDKKDYESWRMKKIPYLEKAIKINQAKISLIMKDIKNNSLNGNLKFSWTAYNSWGKGKKVRLIFSKSGNENIEKLYATHFLKKTETLKNKKLDTV